MPRPPMVAIIGRKNSGKTTLVVRLADALTRRGHRVMTLKHGSHTFNIDPASTDTYRHYHEGGAERVAMAAPDKFALVMRWKQELSPEEIVDRYLSDADIVLCEGFKQSALPKVEVHRVATGTAPLLGSGVVDDSTYRAVVTDDDALVTTATVVRLDRNGWLDELATLVERSIMNRTADAHGS